MPRKIRKSKKKSQKGGWGEYKPPSPSPPPSSLPKPKKNKSKIKKKVGGGKSLKNKQRAGWGGCSTAVMKGGGWGSPSRNVVVDISSQKGGFKRFLNKHF